MATYSVTVTETYLVEARTENEALLKVEEGEAQLMEMERVGEAI